MSCYRTTLLPIRRVDQELTLIVTRKSGDISFTFINKENNEEQVLENPKDGTYKFALTKGNTYRFIIKAKSASGSYKIYRKK